MNAVDMPGVSDRQRVLELQHYFEGPAFSMIEYCVMMDDATAAFKEAMEVLEEKFGKGKESAVEMLDEVLKGKQLTDKDVDGLLMLYSKLRTKYFVAKSMGKDAEFD